MPIADQDPEAVTEIDLASGQLHAVTHLTRDEVIGANPRRRLRSRRS
jgi:hypothetical protein